MGFTRAKLSVFFDVCVCECFANTEIFFFIHVAVKFYYILKLTKLKPFWSTSSSYVFSHEEN